MSWWWPYAVEVFGRIDLFRRVSKRVEVRYCIVGLRDLTRYIGSNKLKDRAVILFRDGAMVKRISGKGGLFL